jgi:hypothetical protein
MRRLIVTGLLRAGMALSANGTFAAQQGITPEGTVIELRMGTASSFLDSSPRLPLW